MNNYTESLEKEIKDFEEQRERVRAIIGQIGGSPTFVKKVENVVFVVLILICFILSLIAKGEKAVLMLEIIVLLVAAKFIYFLYLQNRVIHFQFWILSTLEWRVNEISANMNKLVGRAGGPTA